MGLRVGFTGSSLNNRDRISGSATTQQGLMREFLRQGHEVFWLDHTPDEFTRQECPGVCIDIAESSLSALTNRCPLDVLIIQNWAYNGAAIASAYRSAGTFVALWDDNTPYALDKTSALAEAAHVILTHGEDAAQQLRRLGLSLPIHVFLTATDPYRFKPEYDAAYAADVSFAGTWTDQRNDHLELIFFEPAKQLPTRQFALYGLGWADSEHIRRYPVDWRGWVPNGDLHKAYASAKICVHASVRELRVTDAVIGRVFDVLATGTLLLSDPLPALNHYFAVGEDLIVASSAQEAVHVMDELLDNDRLRQEIAAKGRQAVLNAHTWKHRYDQLLDLLHQHGAL
jgi:spore maturation protein CgeB